MPQKRTARTRGLALTPEDHRRLHEKVEAGEWDKYTACAELKISIPTFMKYMGIKPEPAKKRGAA